MSSLIKIGRAGAKALTCSMNEISVLHRSKVRCGCGRLLTVSRFYSVFEPDGLVTEPEIPEYQSINIHMKGYDYPMLESFAKFAHSVVKMMNLDGESIAIPARSNHMKVYKPHSTNIESEYDLSMYERAIQLEDLPSTMLPLLIEALQQNMPAGIQLTVKEPTPEDEEFRYVPDLMLQELQAQIEEISQAREERKKK